jgi:hypothetical protein
MARKLSQEQLNMVSEVQGLRSMIQNAIYYHKTLDKIILSAKYYDLQEQLAGQGISI